MDRQPAPGLSRAPKRMRRQTVSPRTRPRKRPTFPSTSCGLPRCSSRRLARRCDNPSPQPTTSSCRSRTSEVPSPRLRLPSGCHTPRPLRSCPSYSVSFSRLFWLVEICTLVLLYFFRGRRRVTAPFGGRLSSALLRMNAQIAPRRFRELDAVVVCGFLDVRECQRTIGIGYVYHLIEPRDRVTYMLRVGQWLFALLRKRVDTVWQVTLHRKPSVFPMRFPSRFRHVFAVLSLIFRP